MKCILTASLLAAASQTASAAVLATYDLAAGSLVVTTELFAGSSSDLTLGSDLSTDTVAGNVLGLGADIGTNITTSNGKITFVYTVMGLAAGETLDLDSASLDYTGFGASVRTDFTDTNNFGTVVPANGDATFTDALTATGLVNGDTVTIRFGVRDGASGSGDTYTFDNIVLNGTIVSIPEPSSMALLGLGGFGLLLRRR